MQHNKLAALYCRLSNDDRNDSSESDSISNQEMMLTQYAEKNGFNIVDIYKDDGFTGTNFQRPDFIRMIGDARAKKIDTIIVKDLSRFGREHIQADFYREIEFPQMGVRFIAVNDNYDGARVDHSTNSMAQIKGLFNEWMSSDTSQKVRRVYRAKAENGQYIGIAPYGYRKNPDRKNHLIPCEDTAPIVRKIFDMSAAGDSYMAIAKAFMDKQIPTPYAHKGRKYNAPFEWDYSTIRTILKNPVYLGHCVRCRETKVSYKVNKIVQLPPDQWVTVENTHEPLVSQRVWDIVQSIKTARKRATKSGEPHLFATLIKCSTCSAPLVKSGNTFTCQRYKLYGKDACTSHHITKNRLTASALASIQAVTSEIWHDKSGFIDRVSGIGESVKQKRTEAARKEHDSVTKRLAEISALLKKAFEQNAGGMLPDELYADMLNGYKQEREELTAKMDNLTAAISEADKESAGVKEFVELAEKYIDIKELDRAVLLELVEKIVVHQAEKVDRQQTRKQTQEIDIYYRFVGKI